MNQSKSVGKLIDLIETGTNPHLIQLMVEDGIFTEQEWDTAIDHVREREQYMQEMEERWRASLPTQQQRIEVYGYSPEKIESYRRNYILERYEQLIRASTNEVEQRRLKSEYEYRFEKKGFSPLDVERARGVELSRFIESRGGFARCPFHNEKTASLHLTKNLYHCFGCDKSGNSITYCIEALGMTFKEAVNYLIHL